MKDYLEDLAFLEPRGRMSGLCLLNVFDVARSLGHDPLKATPERVAEWLTGDHLTNAGGLFNYDPAFRALFDLFSGLVTRERATYYCKTKGNPKGLNENAAAISIVADYVLDNISVCYRRPFTAVEAGRVTGETLYIGIKAPMVRVRNQEAFVVVPGFRKTHRPVEAEIDVAYSIVLSHLARDDYAAADFEYLYAGPGKSGEREFRVIWGRERQVFNRDTVDTLLDIYVKGVALAVTSGAELRAPKLAGYRVINPDQPTMF